MKEREKEKNIVYSHILPDIEDWPIFQLSEDRRAFVREIEAHTLEHFMRKDAATLRDIIAKTIYLERIRIKEEPWKVDPPKERQFWKKIRQQLVTHSLDSEEEAATQTHRLILQQILHRYAEEIVGTFNKKTFLFARRFLTMFFTRLLNTAAGRSIWGSKHRLYDRMLVRGNVEAVQNLFTKGTIVVVPTHFSNLDSILIGYALDTFAGLPSFSYGAGLNLYNAGFAAYFMNRLGAYRVDRRKKNTIYLETLKIMSNLSVQRGVNNLFFPGGTRSRSGELETKLKMGLLGTVVEAQRALYAKGEDTKVFVVPLVLSYHFVLEAPFLIEQHLRQMGKERYFKSKDDFNNVWKVLQFAWKFFSKSNTITVSFGQPLDVLGNAVDAQGSSFDKYGNPIDVKDYFLWEGQIKPDTQRETEYTKILADKIVERYYKDNIVLSSHLVSFAAFQVLQRENAKLDLYGILRLPTDDFVFAAETMRSVVKQLQTALQAMEKAGEVKLSEQINWAVEELIADGIRRLGNYHLQKPLKYNKNGEIVSESFKLLYFYHNRLENYGLQDKIQWKRVAAEAEKTPV